PSTPTASRSDTALPYSKYPGHVDTPASGAISVPRNLKPSRDNLQRQHISPSLRPQPHPPIPPLLQTAEVLRRRRRDHNRSQDHKTGQTRPPHGTFLFNNR